jgi:hypothetical protein
VFLRRDDSPASGTTTIHATAADGTLIASSADLGDTFGIRDAYLSVGARVAAHNSKMTVVATSSPAEVG